MATRKEILQVDGREVAVSNPDKVYFPQAGHTKLDLVRYFLAVADGALVGVRGRPMALKPRRSRSSRSAPRRTGPIGCASRR
jgi:DNA primase